MFQAIDTSATGLLAERLRMDVIASNIANAYSTRTTGGGPYRRLMTVLAAEAAPESASPSTSSFSGRGVRVTGIVEDQTPLPTIYDPEHPDAGTDGYVRMPNVNPVTEMVDLITATRAYEANVTVMNAAKQMALKALDIGRA